MNRPKQRRTSLPPSIKSRANLPLQLAESDHRTSHHTHQSTYYSTRLTTLACRLHGDPRNKKPRRLDLVSNLRGAVQRSEEHTSELQSRPHLVCRLLLEKKKN